MKRIKILYIHHVSVIGGASFCLLNIIKHLDKTIFQPIILLRDDGPLAKELIELGATVYFEESITSVLYNKSILRINAINKIIRIIKSLPLIKMWYKKIRPDIVHLNSMMLYPYLYPAHQLGIKTVLHMREHWPEGEHQIQLTLAKRCIKKFADKIAAINQTSADILGLNAKTTIIHDYISFADRNQPYNFETIFGEEYKKLKIFSFFGGTNWQKGALMVVDVFANHIPNNNIRLLVVGGKSKEIVFTGFRGKIKRILSRFNYYRYSDKVKHIAQQDDRIFFVPGTYQVKSIIEQSAAVVSSFSMPHANLTMAEASCLGTPSIAANTPEAKEYCNNGKTALLFEMNNKNDFIKKIQYFLENEDKVQRETKNDHDEMEHLFSPQTNNTLLLNLYLDLQQNIKPNISE